MLRRHPSRSRGAMEGSEARLTVRRRWRGRLVNGALVLVLVGACVDAASGLRAEGGTPRGSRRSLLADEHPGARVAAAPLSARPDPCAGSVVDALGADACAHVRSRCRVRGSLVDYRVLRACVRTRGARVTSVAVMCLVVALVFWILGDTAERYFCPVVKTLADRWNLAPATAGVTLLALGNGAPDVFASLAAFTRGDVVFDDGETADGTTSATAGAAAATGAIVSAGMFVSGAVVGVVALVAAPFPVDPRPFRRDVFCYLAATCATAVVVADGKVHAWEAASLPACYVAFVGYVVWCDARTDPGAKERSRRGGARAGGAGGRSFVGGGGRDHLFGQWTSIGHQKLDIVAANGIVAASVDDGESDRAELGDGFRRRRDAGDVETGRRRTASAAATAARGGFGAPDDDEPTVKTRRRDPSRPENDDEPTVKTRDVTSAAPLAIRASSTTSQLVARARRWFASRWRESRANAVINGDSALRRAIDATTLVFLVAPLECARRATIPCGDPERWNRFYACANAALSPLLLTRLVVSFSGRELGDVFAGVGLGGLGFEGLLGSGDKLGFVGLGMASFAAAAVLWRVTADDAPPRWWTDGGRVDAVAFLCSVAWIAAAARELTECLAAIGDAVGASPASLSVTVLAIGNSLGDLAADVATARGGQPTMAIAACFSGPLFNMAVGLGGSFAIATWRRAGGGGGPPPSGTHSPGGGPLPLATHPTVAIGFGFLIVGLVATAALVPMRGYVVTREHGFGLIALYAMYMVCAVAGEVLTDGGGGGGTMSEPSAAAARWR